MWLKVEVGLSLSSRHLTGGGDVLWLDVLWGAVLPLLVLLLLGPRACCTLATRVSSLSSFLDSSRMVSCG